MYVYDFFKSLSLLRKEKMPDINEIPNEEVFIFGGYPIEELDNYPIELSSQNKNYLIYCKLDNIIDLKSFPIDKYLDYIKRLDSENIDLNLYEPIMLESTLMEAILLLDLISSLEENPFFDAVFNIPLSYLDEFLDSHTCEYIEVNERFMGIELIKDIYFSQILYFIKKYVKVKFCTKQEEIVNPISYEEFSSLIRVKINEYQKLDPFKAPISTYTGIENVEYDNLIYQVELLGERQLDKRRKLS